MGTNVDVSLKIESPEDQLFWSEVRTAYDLVSNNNKREIKVTRGAKQALVFYGDKTDHIMVAISEIEPPQPVPVKP
jgi:hypothetical protein